MAKPSPPVPVAPSAASAQYADVNGARLYFEFSGPQGADTIIFIHHYTMDARMWDDQFAEFAKRYKVLRYDARGYGRSSAINGAYSVAADLRALMDSLGIARAHMVGHSMGGRYAIDFALTYPNRVQTLAVFDPSISGGAFSASFTREFGNIVAPAKSGNVEEAKRRWLASSLFSATRRRPPVMARVGAMVNGYSGHLFAHPDPAVMLDPPAVRQLGKLKSPTLVMVGERSIADFQNFADRIVREVPIARRVVLRGAGHMANMETPMEYNRVLGDFIATPPTTPLSAAARNPMPPIAACVDPVTKRASTVC